MKATSILSIFLSLFFLSGCHKAPKGNPGKNEVWLEYKAFTPTQLTISVGETITFTNKDNADHTATETHHLFDSGKLKTDQSFAYTFSTAGTYYFFCNYHSSNPSEQGAIVVQ
jgi:plastocyanin